MINVSLLLTSRRVGGGIVGPDIYANSCAPRKSAIISRNRSIKGIRPCNSLYFTYARVVNTVACASFSDETPHSRDYSGTQRRQLNRKSTEFAGSSTVHDRRAVRNHGRDGIIADRTDGCLTNLDFERKTAIADLPAGCVRRETRRDSLRVLKTRSFSGLSVFAMYGRRADKWLQPSAAANKRAEGRKRFAGAGSRSSPAKKCSRVGGRAQGREDLTRVPHACGEGFTIEINGMGEESGVIVTYLTSRSLYKRRSYRYEWPLLEHLKPVSLDVCTVYTCEHVVYGRMNLSRGGGPRKIYRKPYRRGNAAAVDAKKGREIARDFLRDSWEPRGEAWYPRYCSFVSFSGWRNDPEKYLFDCAAMIHATDYSAR